MRNDTLTGKRTVSPGCSHEKGNHLQDYQCCSDLYRCGRSSACRKHKIQAGHYGNAQALQLSEIRKGIHFDLQVSIVVEVSEREWNKFFVSTISDRFSSTHSD
eukprot:gb/GECG01007245.1/.p1 GENE.gb/GECG01007245.1/~~gb/GECG01007245.1/.p1  ORF type:complete len:103 (+),score=8.46 gb/GECG01007245.1/:1-309(+)